MSSFTVQVILVRLCWVLEIPDGFSKSTQIQTFMKIHPLGAEFFDADGQPDMIKLIVAFRNLAYAPKM